MFKHTKTRAMTKGEIGNQFSRAKLDSGRLGLCVIALACGGLSIFSLSAVASEDSGDLTPMISDEVEKGLQFGEKNNLAVVIAVDEAGNYKIYRGINMENDGKEVPFPIDAKGISSMNNFTIFKTNPTYIYVNGKLVCI